MLTVENKIIFNSLEKNILWQIYNDSFNEINIKSPCKQSFEEEEFYQMIDNNSVKKYILKSDKINIGIGMITNNFDNLPWISKKFFEYNFNREYTNNEIYYFMGIAIDKNYQKLGYSKILLNEIFKFLKGHAIVGFDHSKKTNPFIPYFTRLLKGVRIKKKKIESQNYYVIEVKN